MGVVIPQVITETKASGAQVIDGSLKFDSNNTTYLSRTPSSAGNQRTWTRGKTNGKCFTSCVCERTRRGA